MGNTLSFDFICSYAIFNGYLDDLEHKNINIVYRLINDFTGYHQIEAVCILLFYKAAFEKNQIVQKYAKLAKMLENEREGGTVIFKDVFSNYVRNLIKQNVENDNIINLSPSLIKHVANFLGHLVIADFYDVDEIKNLINPAYKNKEELKIAFKHFREIIEPKLPNNKTLDDFFLSEDEIRQDNIEADKGQEINQPSTSTHDVPTFDLESIKDYNTFCTKFNKFKSDIHSDEKFFNPKLIASLNLTNKKQIQSLCDKFLNCCLKKNSTYVPVYAQIALRIHSSLQNTKLSKEISFRNLLIETVYKKLNEATSDLNEEEKRTAVSLYGEIFNLDWISKAAMNTFLVDLKKNSSDDSFVLLLQPILKICAIKLSIKGSKEFMSDLRDTIKGIASKEKIDSHIKYLAHDTLGTLNFIITSLEQCEVKVNGTPQPSPSASIKDESKRPRNDEKLTIDNLYRDMSEEAFIEVVNDIKSERIKDIPAFIDNLIEKAMTTCTILVARVTREILTTPEMKELLSNKCHNEFLDYVKDPNKTGSTLRLLHYIAELYNLDVLTNDFINVCFEILFESKDEIGLTGISALLRNIGAKMEIANSSNLNGYFDFFDLIIKSEHSKRSRVYKKLTLLRENNWDEHGIQHSYEDFLMLYTIENATPDEVAIKFHANVEIEKFIYALWKVVLKEPHAAYSVLCQQLSSICKDFNHNLIEFLKARCKTFANLEVQHYNDTVHCRLGKVAVFTAELYQLDVIPDYIFEMWIEPKIASKIPETYIVLITNLLKDKIINLAGNERLKLLIINLEHIKDDKSQKKYNSICGDFEELKKSLNSLKHHQNHN